MVILLDMMESILYEAPVINRLWTLIRIRRGVNAE